MLYLATTGLDTNPCTLAAPCATLQHALSVGAGDQHIVMLEGSYRTDSLVAIDGMSTPASSVIVHGNGSTLSSGFSEGMNTYVISVRIKAVISDLTITRHAFGSDPLGIFVAGTGDLLLRNVTIQNAGGSSVFGTARAEGLRSYGSGWAAVNTAHLTIAGGILDSAISSSGGATLELFNVAVHVGAGIALLTDSATPGGVFYSSFVSDGGTTPAVQCGGLSFDSSIVWAPGTNRAPATAGCTFASSIVGPKAFGTSSNLDPQFADSMLHIKPSSPAVDTAACGSAPEVTIDFDADPRPQGMRCDVGADELKL